MTIPERQPEWVALRDFLMARRCRGSISSADFERVGLKQIIELSVLPFPAAHLGHGMGGLELTFAGLRQSITQAATTQLRRPAMEAMEVSGPCHEHLQVVTKPV